MATHLPAREQRETNRPSLRDRASGFPLTSEENQQMSVMFNFTKGQLLATEPGGRVSNEDVKLAMTEQIRQGVMVSQEALIGQVRNVLEQSERGYAAALAADPEAAAVFEADRKKNEAAIGNTDYVPAGSRRVGR